MSEIAELEKRCADAGLKITGQRRLILQVLVAASIDGHPSVEDLYERAKKIDSSVSMATVYRTVNLLDELNLIVKHEFKESFARFEVNADHHHHLIDLETGDVIEFQNEEIEELKERIANELGYELVDHTLELYGRKIKTN
jgi:Fur family ferric uptake transcriptional regulator